MERWLLGLAAICAVELLDDEEVDDTLKTLHKRSADAFTPLLLLLSVYRRHEQPSIRQYAEMTVPRYNFRRTFRLTCATFEILFNFLGQ